MGTPQLTRLKNVRLSDQAVEQIQALIFSGAYEPGSKLPSESELVASLNVSRTSIREALRALESRGMIQVRSGSGAFVSDQPFHFNAVQDAVRWLLGRKDSLVQILEVRESLEGLAAGLVASHFTPEIEQKLRAIIARQEEAFDREHDIDTLTELDIQFHEIIATESGNEFAEGLIHSIVTQFCTSNRALLYVSGKTEKSIDDHVAILEALKSQNPAAAETAIRSHIARVREDVVRILESERNSSRPTG
jgi:GntR family transcriptional repressor for pyruvate dehydrogenase complex